jgi:hypothetical protein
LEIEITKRVDDRALRVRKRKSHLRTPVDPASQPDDSWKKFSCFTEKCFKIM